MFEAAAPERADWSGGLRPGRNGLATVVEFRQADGDGITLISQHVENNI